MRRPQPRTGARFSRIPSIRRSNREKGSLRPFAREPWNAVVGVRGKGRGVSPDLRRTLCSVSDSSPSALGPWHSTWNRLGEAPGANVAWKIPTNRGCALKRSNARLRKEMVKCHAMETTKRRRFRRTAVAGLRGIPPQGSGQVAPRFPGRHW